MSQTDLLPTPEALTEAEASRKRRLVMQHLQVIEGNPLDAEEIAMFEMFEREEWDDERCLAHIGERVRKLRDGA